jgi:ABC-type glycerol-3-phosphate transport system substrate-binding protein
MKPKTWQELEKLADKAESDGPPFLGAVLRDFAQAWKAEVEALAKAACKGAKEIRIDTINIGA